MSGTVHSLFHAPPESALPPPDGDPVDYCQCNRGAVIGYADYTSTRMVFLPLGTPQAELPENCLELRCIDCVADIAADLASGRVSEQMATEVRERTEEMRALIRRREISQANRSGQSPPTEGAGMT